jgi:tetratricopeptide (TPR) repeat protein
MNQKDFAESLDRLKLSIDQEDFHTAKRIARTLGSINCAAMPSDKVQLLQVHTAILEVYSSPDETTRSKLIETVNFESLDYLLKAEILRLIAFLDIERKNYSEAEARINKGLALLPERTNAADVLNARLQLLNLMVHLKLHQNKTDDTSQALNDLIRTFESHKAQTNSFVLTLLRTISAVEKFRGNRQARDAAIQKAYQLGGELDKAGSIAYMFILEEMSAISLNHGRLADSLSQMLEAYGISKRKFGILRGRTRLLLLELGIRLALMRRFKEAQLCYLKIIRAERLARIEKGFSSIASDRLANLA